MKRNRPGRLAAARRILLAISLALGASAAVSSAAAAAHPRPFTLYVSPTGSSLNSDTSCSDAGYSSIQDAVNAAISGQTVFVCAGNYAEQVEISTSGITLTSAGPAAVIDPATATVTATDLDSGQTIVPILYVEPGTSGVTISDLAVDGSALGATLQSCAEDFIGILLQSASGTIASASVRNIQLPPALAGCQDGQGIYVQSAPGAGSSVTIQGDTVSGYDKNGITCNDAGTGCSISEDSVTGSGPTTAAAQNGIQLGFGASGMVSGNRVAGNDYTGQPNPTEPQADYAAGVLLYAAGGQSQVHRNALSDDQIAVEVVHSDAGIDHNTIGQTGSGIAGSIGVFAVPCDYYCSYFGLSGGNEHDVIVGNDISFPGAPTAGSYGIWAGDPAASSTGTVHVNLGDDAISGAQIPVEVDDPTAERTG
jgi:hypothetical protein